MRPDFSVLDAYYDLWQVLASGDDVTPQTVNALLSMPQYRGSLHHYEQELGIAPSQLAQTLLSLQKEAPPYPDHPVLHNFWLRQRQAVTEVPYLFDIIFPMRRLSLAHAMHPLQRSGRELPSWLRIMPDLVEQAYLTADALVINFFLISIDPAGHLAIAGTPVAEYAKEVLSHL